MKLHSCQLLHSLSKIGKCFKTKQTFPLLTSPCCSKTCHGAARVHSPSLTPRPGESLSYCSVAESEGWCRPNTRLEWKYSAKIIPVTAENISVRKIFWKWPVRELKGFYRILICGEWFLDDDPVSGIQSDNQDGSDKSGQRHPPPGPRLGLPGEVHLQVLLHRLLQQGPRGDTGQHSPGHSQAVSRSWSEIHLREDIGSYSVHFYAPEIDHLDWVQSSPSYSKIRITNIIRSFRQDDLIIIILQMIWSLLFISNISTDDGWQNSRPC